MRFLNDNLGRMLLVAAIGCAGAAVYLNPRRQHEPIAEDLLKRPVQVKLDKNALSAGSSETFFVPDDGMQYAGTERAVWVKEVRVIEFQPVDLPLPSAGIMRAPQLLPEPGPSLEGSHKLPRFGDEFPPLTPPPAADPKAAPKAGAAPATTPGKAPVVTTQGGGASPPAKAP